MKKNIYISYIHSESMNYKFKILDQFRGRKYKLSEESFDPSLSSTPQTDEILTKIAKNIAHSEVTVVLISRSVLQSAYIPIEVDYSLDSSKRFSRLPLPKGVVGVVIPDKGNDYSYLMKKGSKGLWVADPAKLPLIISKNMYNEKVVQNKHNIHYHSFISIYRWEDFVRNFDECIEAAYDKATNFSDDYNITLK